MHGNVWEWCDDLLDPKVPGSVRVNRGRGTVRTAEHSGFAFDVDKEPPASLSVAVQQLGIKRIQAYGRDAAKLSPFAAPLGVEVIDLKRDFDAGSIAGAINLLQGRFAPTGGFGMNTGVGDAFDLTCTKQSRRLGIAQLEREAIDDVDTDGLGETLHALEREREARLDEILRLA